MNTEALQDLMEALNKLFGDMPEEKAEGEDEPKKKAMTIISIGKGKPDGLKIPKKKKVEEEEDELA